MKMNQKKNDLRAKAHHLDPVVIIGKNGLTEAVLEEIDAALNAHELIKIKIGAADRFTRIETAQVICDHLEAEQISAIGGVVVIHRENKDDKK